MMLRSLKLLALITLFALTAACDGREGKLPEGILPRDSVVVILADIHIAEAGALNKTAGGDVLKQFAKDHYLYVLQIHNTTREAFEKSYRYYAEEPEKFESMYTDVINELSRRQAEAAN
jgi:hypothetical protein